MNSNLHDHDTSMSQTDGQTDGQTTCHGTALCVASRGNDVSQIKAAWNIHRRESGQVGCG